MIVDTTSLFLHVLAAAGIVGGGLAQLLAGFRLRRAARGDGVVEWAGFVRTLGWVVAGASVISFLTGGHLAGAVWTTEERSGFSFPFITLGVVALVVLVPIGPMLGGARLKRIVAAARDGSPSDVSADLRSPGLWGPIHSLLGVATALVAVMTYKPGWFTTAVVLLVGFGLGWASGVAVAQRSREQRP